jgi:hypothetical protein
MLALNLAGSCPIIHRGLGRGGAQPQVRHSRRNE